jgi:hypothetical protein
MALPIQFFVFYQYSYENIGLLYISMPGAPGENKEPDAIAHAAFSAHSASARTGRRLRRSSVRPPFFA